MLALEADAERLDHELETLVRRTAPSLLDVTASGSTPPRSCSSPRATIPTDSKAKPRSRISAASHHCKHHPGKMIRHRLDPGGNRQANHALWRIVFTRMSGDERTRKYVARRTAEGRHDPRDHARLETLRRPRGLPAPRARLNRSGVAGLAHELP